MTKRQFGLWVASLTFLASFLSSGLHAQYAKAPETYSITEINSMMGTPVTMQIYRDGSKALVEQSSPQGSHTRTLYDLKTQQTYTLDLVHTSVPCGSGTFSGDWGDPFAMSAEINGDLAKQNPKEAGTETVNGVMTTVVKAAIPDNASTAWVEKKYGLIMKLQVTGISGQAQTLLEMKQLSFSKPPASTFVLPEVCAQAKNSPRIPTEAERIAAETGGKAEGFANASMPPASKDSCTVLFKIVRAGTMQPITSGFQIALDTQVDLDHPASYSTGLGANGHASFSGGHLNEMTRQLHNGVLRIENAPPQFDMEIYFGNGGDASALIYRQCFSPETTLLFVIKNPAKLSDGGDWLWVKSSK